ncbi:MAG TPA: hypothetical protein VGE63_01540 [Candidatus Paceibacterota bacterium]
MKKILCYCYRKFFILVFIASLGIFQAIWEYGKKPERKTWENTFEIPPGTDRFNNGRMFGDFCNKKLSKANENFHKGIPYSPYTCYKDLREIALLKKALGILQPAPPHLITLMHEGVRSGKYTYKDVAKAYAMYMPETYNERKKRTYQGDVWIDMSSWLLKMYLKMLPWAFLLLLIWNYEKNESSSFKIKSPLGFFVSLLGYPIVLIIVAYRWLHLKQRFFEASVEMRRTRDNMLELLSEEDIQLAWRYAHSKIRLQDLRQIHGRALKHSFGAAWIATVIITVAPQAIESTATMIVAYDVVITTTHTCCSKSRQSKAPPDFLYTVYKDKEIPSFLVYDMESLEITKYLKHFFKDFESRILKGFTRSLESVPLYGLISALGLITYKLKINEKNNHISNNFFC